MRVKITYSGGDVVYEDGWSLLMVGKMRAAWRQIHNPPSTATIEVVDQDQDQDQDQDPESFEDPSAT